MLCEVCGGEIPPERLDALPDTTRCVVHSSAARTEGLLDYGHKTAPSLVILPNDPEQKRIARRAFRRAR